MADGWRYTKLSLLSAFLLYFSDLCCCSFFFVVFVLFLIFVSMLSSDLVDVLLIFLCPADYVPDWQPTTYITAGYG